MARDNFIGGSVEAGARAAPPTRCSNPATGEVLDEVASSDAADVDDAVAAAAAAFDEWSNTTPRAALRDC